MIGTEIYVFPPEYYLASKFEAHHYRGGNGGLSEGIESALPYGSDSDRVEIIKALILEIASLD